MGGAEGQKEERRREDANETVGSGGSTGDVRADGENGGVPDDTVLPRQPRSRRAVRVKSNRRPDGCHWPGVAVLLACTSGRGRRGRKRGRGRDRVPAGGAPAARRCHTPHPQWGRLGVGAGCWQDETLARCRRALAWREGPARPVSCSTADSSARHRVSKPPSRYSKELPSKQRSGSRGVVQLGQRTVSTVRDKADCRVLLELH